MAFLDDDGNIQFSPAELHALETEFFQFETKLKALSFEEMQGEVLKAKWNELLLRERFALYERTPKRKNWFND